jgi:PAS domain S-box-containing protein
MREQIKKGDVSGDNAAFINDLSNMLDHLLQDKNLRNNSALKTFIDKTREGIEKGKKIDQDLTTEKIFSKAVIEAIPELFYVLDENLRVIRWNKNVESMTGYPADKISKYAPEFSADEDVLLVKEWLKEVSLKGKSTLYSKYKYYDGTVHPYFWTGVKTTIEGKEYHIGVGVDCSEIEKIKESLKESEERLSLAADSAGAGLWAMDFKTGLLWMTPICMGLHCLGSDSAMQYDTLLNSIHRADRKKFADAVRNTMKTGQALRTEYRVALPKNQCRWISVRGRLFYSTQGERERLTGVSIDITDRKMMENQLKEQMEEVVALKKQLEKDNVYLREEVKQLSDHEGVIGESEAFKEVLTKASQVAKTNSTVLILGETGTGKEVLARLIHNLSSRRDRPLITVNCASLPPSLIEGELFGREKGAYTGALTKMNGRFEMANGSTLFLDEIGELPYELQGKLLRAIELGQFERLGSTRTMQVNVRIIAATNRDLAKAIKEDRFRKDLYYRLNVFPINIPPLRERPEDIPCLVQAFVRHYENVLGKRIENIPAKTMEALREHMWSGNVRELKNVIERAMIISNKTLNVMLPSMPIEEANERYDKL